MKLYMIWRSDTFGYDEYDSAVVAASDEGAALRTYPGNSNSPYDRFWSDERDCWYYTAANGEVIDDTRFSSWTNISSIKVELLGTAVRGTKAGVICASFNAG